MAWWEIFDDPDLYQTEGVFLFAGVATLILLLAALGIAYAWHAWRDKPHGATHRKP